MRKATLLACAGALFMAAPAQAVVLSSAGDADCFGLGGSCPPGTGWQTDLGGVFFTDYSDPGDAPFTDVWMSTTNPTYNLSYAGGTNLFVEILVAGIGDVGGPYSVLFNGTAIGDITTNASANAFEEVRLFTFAVADGLLLANNVVSFTTNGGDGYAVDYVSLNSSVGAVPEPSTWAMMLMGFGAAGFAMRRVRRSRALAAA